MKLTKSILALALLTGSGLAHAAAPQVKVIDRVETPVAFGRPVLINEKDGSKTLVQLETLADDKFNLRLVARGAGGKVLLETKAGKPATGEQLYINEAKRNQAGDLVVITYYNRNTATSGRIYSDNLTTKKSAMLAEGSFPTLVDRIRVGNQNLALVSTYLGHGPGDTRPELLRVLDEDDGKVISQTVLDFGISGKFGLNSKGEVKILATGYELFGLIDAASGKFTALLPERRQPSQYPAYLHLATGDFLSLNDANEMHLLDIPSLFEGNISVVKRFAAGTTFLGGDAPNLVLERNAEGILVSDLVSGKALGPVIPSPNRGRSERSIGSIVSTPLGLVALVYEAKVPNSYMPGTILTYVELATGKVLRRIDHDNYQLFGQAVVVNGRILSLETVNDFQAEGYQLVDVVSGKVLQSGDHLLPSKVIQTASGHILALKANAQKQVCVFDLEIPSDATCLSDPLLQADGLKYGYEPREIGETVGKLVLP
ncbi:MAG: hypothetical protein ACXWQO_11425, partial [Bdellovibrionota bacterium]